ncbi:MAG: ferrochelatase [Caulobacterales bacterium]
MSRIAVVLFNLGGPDGPASVQPFLRNLFADPAIIAAPTPIRLALAEIISRTRARSAKANYSVMGGGSPLLGETEAQAGALTVALARLRPSDEVRCFIAMRYWRPFIRDAARQVEAFAPDEVVLAPLYPQYSSTTSASSLEAWRGAYRGEGREHAICCYFEDEAVVAAQASLIERTWVAAGRPPGLRLLFSAHGLPERIAASGDPYQFQVEATCARVAERLGDRLGGPLDWQVCYQSRVGPLKWIGPYTDAAIRQAGRDGKGVILTPIAFVCEHIETLVELDRDYAKIAANVGAAPYLRVPALGVERLFIEGLSALIDRALVRPGVGPAGRACAAGFAKCGLRTFSETSP